jgi:hypothetical protein
MPQAHVTGFACSLDGRECSRGPAALGRFLDRRIDLAEPTIEIGNGVGRNLDPGGKSCVLHLDRRCSLTTLAYRGGDELSINASRIDDGKAGDEHSEGKAPDRGRHTPPPGEPILRSRAWHPPSRTP